MKIKLEKLDIPQGCKIVIAGPDSVDWMNNIAFDIRNLRGKTPPALPSRDKCRFHYPHLIRRKNIQELSARAATLEMLTSSWVLLEYFDAKKPGIPSYIVYYRGGGKSVDEFYYLIDYLMHYQVLKTGISIHIRTYNSDPIAVVMFNKAKKLYLECNDEADGIRGMLDSVTIDEISDIVTKFSTYQMGLL